MRYLNESYDVVVCGAGLAGVCAAVTAARHGARTVLIGDRPVLGGNSSSEIRVIPRGAGVYHAYGRETGLISELLIEDRARNHEELFENGWTNSVWDLLLYDLVMRTENLSLHLNTSITEVATNGREVSSVTGRVANAETELTIAGAIFCDCTGDGVIADLSGCEWRMGTEGCAEFGETHAPTEPTDAVMGNSIHLKTKDVGYPVPFELPSWAQEYDDASFFYKGGRVPHTLKGGYWWLEIGVPWHTIYDNEEIRHELTRHALGVWDWIKNKDPKLKDQAATYALDWIGQVPGKRESRRIVGRYLMTEQDLFRDEPFPDEVAYAGWNIDLHTPGGLLAPTSEPTAAEGHSPTGSAAVAAYVGPLGMPLRSLIANDCDNLLMAGRNVSVTHVALGAARVQATTALLGQAAGTAASVALHRGLAVPDVPEQAIGQVQQSLLRDGCFLPNYAGADPDDLARQARVSASSSAPLVGVGPRSAGVDGGLRFASPVDDPGADVLDARRGQWIALETVGERASGVGGEGRAGRGGSEEPAATGGMETVGGRYRLDTVEVCLSNDSETDQEVEAVLVEVDHLWDYRVDPCPPLARTTLTVPPGGLQWIGWPVALDAAATEAAPGQGHRFVRLDLAANPSVRWHRAGALQPGHTSAFQMPGSPEGKKMRRYLKGATMSFRLDPPQAAYEPGNVLSGETRPHKGTNLWRSDPARPLDAWLQLAWDRPHRLRTVELTFAGNVVRDYEAYPPRFHDPQCVRDYTVQAYDGDRWVELDSVTGNYQRQRRHRLAEGVTADRLRIVVHATNGDPSAAIYELRCYS